MARPKRKRMVCWEPDYIHFQPDGISPSEQIILSVDEYEVIRLVDFEKKTHEETARQMQISRTTVTEIYESARFKLADCIVNGKQLRIAGGPYHFMTDFKEPAKKMAAAGEARAEHSSKHRQYCLRKGDKQ